DPSLTRRVSAERHSLAWYTWWRTISHLAYEVSPFGRRIPGPGIALARWGRAGGDRTLRALRWPAGRPDAAASLRPPLPARGSGGRRAIGLPQLFRRCTRGPIRLRAEWRSVAAPRGNHP